MLFSFLHNPSNMQLAASEISANFQISLFTTLQSMLYIFSNMTEQLFKPKIMSTIQTTFPSLNTNVNEKCT